MLDKFFCKVNDKRIEFPSEKEAIEYCKENDINPHGIILMGDKPIRRQHLRHQGQWQSRCGL